MPKNLTSQDQNKILQEYLDRFSALSDSELINLFNREIGNSGWVSRRAIYLSALHHELELRHIDYSAAGSQKSFSLKTRVRLDGKKLVLDNKKVKILHFEDDKFLRNMYAVKFPLIGFDFVGFDSPTKDPVALVLKEKPDLIIMDIIMPISDGFTATKLLKADKRTKDIPILGLCNLGLSEDIQKAKELGMTDYFVSANHTPTEVVKKVCQILGVPMPPEKPIPPPGEAWHGTSVAALPPDKPKSWWQKLFG